MNRPLKFRAYIPAENRIVQCSSIGWNKGYGCMEVFIDNPSYDPIKMIDGLNSGHKYLELPFFSYTEREDKIIILQYSGMDSVDKQEIYEADFVQNSAMKDNNDKWEVEFDRGVFGAKGMALRGIVGLKVVGNKYIKQK